MFNKIGSKWSQISKMEPLVGRTVSQIKNRYYQNLKDKNLDQIRYKVDKKRKREHHKENHTEKNPNKRKIKAKQKSEAIRIRLKTSESIEDIAYSANKHCFSTKENSPFVQNVPFMSRSQVKITKKALDRIEEEKDNRFGFDTFSSSSSNSSNSDSKSHVYEKFEKSTVENP